MRDLCSGPLGDGLRHLIEAEGFGSCQRVGLARVPVGGQRGDGDGGDVAGVNHGDSSLAGGSGDPATTDHAEQVLHEEYWTENRRSKTGFLERLFGLPVLASDLEW